MLLISAASVRAQQLPALQNITNVNDGAVHDTDLMYDYQTGKSVLDTNVTALQFKNYVLLGAQPLSSTLTSLSGTAPFTAGTNITITGTWPNQTVSADGLGTMTLGSNATGAGLTFSSGVLNLSAPVNTANGLVKLDSNHWLVTGLLGNYIGVSGGVQGYDANTTILGNTTTGTGTTIVLQNGAVLTGAVINGVTLAGSGTLTIGSGGTVLYTTAIGSTVQGYNAETTVLGNTTTGAGSLVQSSSPALTGTAATLNGVNLATQQSVLTGNSVISNSTLGSALYGISTKVTYTSQTATMTSLAPVFIGSGTGTYGITCSLEYPTGTLTSFTCNGTGSFTMTGTTTARFDSLPVNIPAGTQYAIRTCYNASPNQVNFSQNVAVYNSTSGWWHLDSSLPVVDFTKTTAGQPGDSSPGYFMSGPDHIIATVAPSPAGSVPSILIIGDSISIGVGDGGYSGNSGTGNGLFYRSLAPQFSFYDWGIGGMYLSTQASATFPDAASYCNYAISELGVNDIYGHGDSLATLQGHYITLWTRLRNMGVAVYQTTITPETSSTDGWTTLTNQTISGSEPTREALNAWIRTVPYPLSGYFEVADKVEPYRNSGLWNPINGAAPTNDGIHPNANAAALQAQGIISNVFMGAPFSLGQPFILQPILTPNSTGTIVFNSQGYNQTVYNASATTIASGTITLSGSSVANQTNTYITKGNVTSLTTTGGAVIIGTPPTSLTAPATVEFRCTATGTWIETR